MQKYFTVFSSNFARSFHLMITCSNLRERKIAVNMSSYHFKFHKSTENNTCNNQLHSSFSLLLIGMKLSSFAVIVTLCNIFQIIEFLDMA